MKQQIEIIQTVLDAAIAKGIIGDLLSAGKIAFAWEEIQQELRPKPKPKRIKNKKPVIDEPGN